MTAKKTPKKQVPKKTVEDVYFLTSLDYSAEFETEEGKAYSLDVEEWIERGRPTAITIEVKVKA